MNDKKNKNVGSFLAFNERFFEKYQKTILFFLNNKLLKRWSRWIFRITKDDISIKEKINEIKPNRFTFGEKLVWDKDSKQLLKIIKTDFRTHPKFGKRIYFAFKYVWWLFHAWDWVFADRLVPQLSFGFSTLTAYPAAGANSPVDGAISNDASDTGEGGDFVWGWTTCRDASAGSSANVTNTSGYLLRSGGYGFPGSMTWNIVRGFFLFDTSSITSTPSIDSAVFSFCTNGTAPTSAASNTSYNTVEVVNSSPASNDNLVVGDYDQRGSTSFASLAFSSIAGTDGQYKDLTLNSSGKSNIDKGGISKFALITGYDLVGNISSGNASHASVSGYFADQTGTSKDPKLVVVYHIAYTSVLTESVVVNSIAPTFLRQYNKTLSSTITLVSTLLKSGARTFTQSISLVATFVKSRLYFKTLSEILRINHYFGGAFNALGASALSYYAITAAPNGDIYACVYNGEIYKQTGGVGAFVSVSAGVKKWVGICVAPNGDVYASTDGVSIWKQTGGSGAFVDLTQTSRPWRKMAAAPNGDIYCCTFAGDIYKQAGGTGNFDPISAGSQYWYGITVAPNGDIYAATYYSVKDLWKQTGGAGAFNRLNETARDYTTISAAPNGDIYAGAYTSQGLYKQSYGVGAFVSVSGTTRLWIATCVAPNGDVYAVVNNGDIYKMTSKGLVFFVSKRLSSTVTVNETLIKRGVFYRTLSSTITVVGSVIKKKLFVISEIISIIDKKIISFSKQLSSSITVNDTIIKRGVFFRTINETIVLVDILLKSIGLMFKETLSISAVLLKGMTKLFIQTIVINPVINILRASFFNEIIRVIDVVDKIFGKVFKESITLVTKLIIRLNGLATNLWGVLRRNRGDWGLSGRNRGAWGKGTRNRGGWTRRGR